MVTGGCGFIGSHLVPALLARGARQVVVVDGLRYGDPARLAALGDAVVLVRHTLGTDSAAALGEALRGVDYLFHLAAEKHGQSSADPLAMLRSNVEGTYALFDLAARGGVRKTVFTSSLYAYGRMAGPPFAEDEPARPRTVYGITKLCGELFLDQLRGARGMAANALRYLFVYGPRQYASMGYRTVIAKNLARLLAGEPPVIFGDGEQALDYVFVDDAVAATIAALEADVEGEVLNVASGVPTTINQLVAAMQAVAGTALAPRFEAADFTAGSCRVGDPDKAARLLGWRATTPLAVGLARTCAWLRAGGAPAG